MIELSAHPLNAETALDVLRASFVTPAREFYIRSHGDIPRLKEASHTIRIHGRVSSPLDLSVADLRARFTMRSVSATMQCAGNRRSELHAVRPVSGDKWAAGAIGNAIWTGVRLADVLTAAGAHDDPSLHVAFLAADEIHWDNEAPFHYGVSIPMAKAMAPEVMLALAMNDEPLRPEHGFPVRLVVPGYAGVRSPKWVTAIAVRDTPSDTPIQQRDYKMFPSDVTEDTVNWHTGVTIDQTPLHAVICRPSPAARLQSGPTEVSGYAIASGREIARVEISCDDGKVWHQAGLEPTSGWSWTFWKASIDLPPGQIELAVRAWDSAGQTQPSSVADIWNFKGYLNAAWHRVAVSVG